MRRYESRLATLERHLSPPSTPWAALTAAKVRSQARARLTLCHRLGVDPEDPRVLEAAGHLTHDTPGQRQADEALLASWPQGHDTGEVRARLNARLEEMAARLDARAL